MTTTGSFDLAASIARMRLFGTDIQNIEVKSAARELPKSIVETISAFANGSGGTIICGVSEKGGFLPVDGFDVKRTVDALANLCSEKLEPPVRADIQIESLEGSLVVVAHIPEVPPYLKPCYVKACTPYDGSFIRTGDGDRRLGRYEVDRILENRHQPQWDREVVEDADAADLDPQLLRGLLDRERANSPYVFATLTDEEAMLSLGVLSRSNEIEGAYRPTLAGLMALGRHPQQFFPRLNVSFAVIPGVSKEDLSPSGMRFLDSRTIIGPIPVMISEAMATLRRNMRVASYIKGAVRIDVPDYPEVAVREALANALMHRDYSPEGRGTQVQVNMYADRIEISNPGGLFGAVTVDRLGEFDVSASRNQTLARLLESTPFPAGYAERGFVVENKGTGFFQIKRSLAEAQMEPPEAKDTISMFYLTFRRRPDGAGDPRDASSPVPRGNTSTSLTNHAVDGFVSQSLARDERGRRLNASDMAVLSCLSRSPTTRLRSSEITKALGLSRATVLRSLGKLVDKGRVEKHVEPGRSNVTYSLVGD